MLQTLLQRHRVLLLHISFWFVYVSFLVYQITNKPWTQDLAWTKMLSFVSMQLVFTLIISYFNYFYLLPRFLQAKNFWRYALAFSIPFVLVVAARVHLQRFLIDSYTHTEKYFYSTLYIVQTASIMIFIVIFVGMLRFAVEWFELEARKKEIENEKLMAELNFLKAQINPHFLFNTLNNLYYLVFTKADKATDVIAKLSQMMRYMIYETNHAKVSMDKEIEYMQNYIDLERMRLNNEIPIRLHIEGDTTQASIAPLIFITFLENAFKHGVSNNKPEAWVNIEIIMAGNACIYRVENSKLTNSHPNANGKSGIGLQNVNRRLELSYPDQYTLTTIDLPEKYSVELKLTLS